MYPDYCHRVKNISTSIPEKVEKIEALAKKWFSYNTGIVSDKYWIFLRLKIREGELEVVQKTKYLDAQIEDSLDWKEHCKADLSKVSKAIGFFWHAKSLLPEETHKTL